MRFQNAANRRALGAAILSVAAASLASAQAPAAAGSAPVPAVGSAAPDFTLPGATRYGLLAQPVRLSDFRGKTVVIAFFYQARTKG
ncbi:MAG TPA: redoxin domain-containing protein [Gemmatimonadaceae bacterium]|nr:redoxin domain-containing protein [Gemmatimonadaceae bacterium]